MPWAVRLRSISVRFPPSSRTLRCCMCCSCPFAVPSSIFEHPSAKGLSMLFRFCHCIVSGLSIPFISTTNFQRECLPVFQLCEIIRLTAAIPQPRASSSISACIYGSLQSRQVDLAELLLHAGLLTPQILRRCMLVLLPPLRGPAQRATCCVYQTSSHHMP